MEKGYRHLVETFYAVTHTHTHPPPPDDRLKPDESVLFEHDIEASMSI